MARMQGFNALQNGQPKIILPGRRLASGQIEIRNVDKYKRVVTIYGKVIHNFWKYDHFVPVANRRANRKSVVPGTDSLELTRL